MIGLPLNARFVVRLGFPTSTRSPSADAAGTRPILGIVGSSGGGVAPMSPALTRASRMRRRSVLLSCLPRCSPLRVPSPANRIRPYCQAYSTRLSSRSSGSPVVVSTRLLCPRLGVGRRHRRLVCIHRRSAGSVRPFRFRGSLSAFRSIGGRLPDGFHEGRLRTGWLRYDFNDGGRGPGWLGGLRGGLVRRWHQAPPYQRQRSRWERTRLTTCRTCSDAGALS